MPKYLTIIFFWGLLIKGCTKSLLSQKNDASLVPKVVQIYPSADTLPKNLLRFYVQFSESMKAVNNLENIKITDATGREVEGAIFNNVYELWDKNQKQLTLILDPARVKTGLIANQNFGRALKQGEKYQLIIEEAENIQGNKMGGPYIKEFFVSEEDFEIPIIRNEQIILPKYNTTTPLQISFSAPVDRMSLYHKIAVFNSKHEQIEGSPKSGNKEKEWKFFPNQKWEKGLYKIQVSSRLEDPSGNNLLGLFDHDIGSIQAQNEGKTLEFTFEIQ